jgi:hypothetical protein
MVSKSFLVGALLLAALGAQAQGTVTAAMGTRTVLKAFVDADGKTESTPLNVKDINFPLQVFEISEAGFLRVKVGGADVWLDRKQVRMPPESLEVSCTTVNVANAKLVSGGIRGANTGCK